MDSFVNGTYQLADLDGTLHALRVNGFRLKKYHSRLMPLLKDEVHEGEETSNEDAVMTEDAKGFTLLFAAADHEFDLAS